MTRVSLTAPKEKIMRRGIVVLILSIVFASPAFAHARHHRHHVHPMVSGVGHGLIHMLKSMHRDQLYICAGCVVRHTAAGVVAVSERSADRLVGAINALVEAGFRGDINCAAPYGTHVARSLHHTGDACDMAQTGWGRSSARIMYHASDILARFGVNDGCSFGDCGHISVGSREAFGGRRYASRRHRIHYARN